MNNAAQPGWLLPAGFININIAQQQIGPVTFHEVGSYTQKTWTHFANGSSEKKKIGMYNHWDNMKFRYLGPNSDFAQYTVQDSINNNIGLQFGLGGASSLVIT